MPIDGWTLDQIDLSVGSAFPSTNGAIQENPAALPGTGRGGEAKVFDLSALVNGGFPDFAGSFSAGMGGFGYGIEVKKISNQFEFVGGFGASVDRFSIGVNATTAFTSISPKFDLGLRYGDDFIAYALVLRDLGNFGTFWTLGLGFSAARMFRFGFDFNFNSTIPIIGISSVQLNAIAEFYASQKFSFRLNYGIGIVPTFQLGSPALGAGLNFWFAPTVAFYGLYNDYSQGYSYILGLKFLLR